MQYKSSKKKCKMIKERNWKIDNFYKNLHGRSDYAVVLGTIQIGSTPIAGIFLKIYIYLSLNWYIYQNLFMLDRLIIYKTVTYYFIKWIKRNLK